MKEFLAKFQKEFLDKSLKESREKRYWNNGKRIPEKILRCMHEKDPVRILSGIENIIL